MHTSSEEVGTSPALQLPFVNQSELPAPPVQAVLHVALAAAAPRAAELPPKAGAASSRSASRGTAKVAAHRANQVLLFCISTSWNGGDCWPAPLVIAQCSRVPPSRFAASGKPVARPPRSAPNNRTRRQQCNSWHIA